MAHAAESWLQLHLKIGHGVIVLIAEPQRAPPFTPIVLDLENHHVGPFLQRDAGDDILHPGPSHLPILQSAVEVNLAVVIEANFELEILSLFLRLNLGDRVAHMKLRPLAEKFVEAHAVALGGVLLPDIGHAIDFYLFSQPWTQTGLCSHLLTV
jgi:hypothetical protein